MIFFAYYSDIFFYHTALGMSCYWIQEHHTRSFTFTAEINWITYEYSLLCVSKRTALLLSMWKTSATYRTTERSSLNPTGCPHSPRWWVLFLSAPLYRSHTIERAERQTKEWFSYICKVTGVCCEYRASRTFIIAVRLQGAISKKELFWALSLHDLRPSTSLIHFFSLIPRQTEHNKVYRNTIDEMYQIGKIYI